MSIESFSHAANVVRHLARVYGVKFTDARGRRESGVEARPTEDAAELLDQITQLREAGVLQQGDERGVWLEAYAAQLAQLLERQAMEAGYGTP